MKMLTQVKVAEVYRAVREKTLKDCELKGLIKTHFNPACDFGLSHI